MGAIAKQLLTTIHGCRAAVGPLRSTVLDLVACHGSAVAAQVIDALRHGQNARLIDVRVAGDQSTVSRVVRDAGDTGAADPAPEAGFGLPGMVECALLLDGACRVDPCPGRGSRANLMDIRMPILDGVEATRLLAGPGVDDPVAVVVITTVDLDEYVHGALLAGAIGFLLEDSGPELIREAIRAATRGDSPSVTRRLLSTVAGTGRAAPRAQPLDRLTEREEQVLLGWADPPRTAVAGTHG